MTPQELQALIDIGKILSVPGLLIIILWLGQKSEPGWVFGSVYKAMKEDRDYWKDLAIHSMGLLADSSEVGEQAVKIARSTSRSRPLAQRKRESGHDSNRTPPDS